ncbi:hypothetical protein, partial [Advenella mandrilli]|uniref:hypothetical protein n=1 Tax=Advenella mandrilli TaxID=2800330 RepID=UPI001F383747
MIFIGKEKKEKDKRCVNGLSFLLLVVNWHTVIFVMLRCDRSKCQAVAHHLAAGLMNKLIMHGKTAAQWMWCKNT